jgi:hypothetical protein
MMRQKNHTIRRRDRNDDMKILINHKMRLSCITTKKMDVT